MELKRRNLDNPNGIECAFFTCSMGRADDDYSGIILVVAFKGVCGIGSANNSDATFMAAMIKAGIEAWSPDALVLDLRELDYRWGDMMSKVLGAGEYSMFKQVINGDGEANQDLPTAVVISDLNREGLTSLVEMEMFAKTQDWLCESWEAAAALVSNTKR